MVTPEITPAGTIKNDTVGETTAVRNVVFGVLLGIVGTVLLYGRLLALGFTVFVLLLMLSMFINARMQGIKLTHFHLLMVIPPLFFATMFTIRSDDSLALWNFAVGAFAALLLVYHFRKGNIAQNDLYSNVRISVYTAGDIVRQPPKA